MQFIKERKLHSVTHKALLLNLRKLTGGNQIFCSPQQFILRNKNGLFPVSLPEIQSHIYVGVLNPWCLWKEKLIVTSNIDMHKFPFIYLWASPEPLLILWYLVPWHLFMKQNETLKQTMVLSVVLSPSVSSFLPSVPPRIGDSPTTIRSLVGDNIVLPCEAVGVPIPVVMWSRGGEKYPAQDARFEQLQQGSLSIRNAKEGDSGKYLCIAVSEAGSESKTLWLEVNGKQRDKAECKRTLRTQKYHN